MRSVFDMFDLARRDFAPLPFDPLHLVAVPDAAPRLIISYDHHGPARVLPPDLLRPVPGCTHVNVTIVPDKGEAPVCAGFGAACLAETLQQGQLQRLNMHMQALGKEIFGCLDHLPGVVKILHPSLTRQVLGQVVDESWRLCDSFISMPLLSDRQIAGALDIIKDWQNHPPAYEVRSLKGMNCKDFVGAVIEGAGLRKPWGWNIKPWPGLDMLWHEVACGRQIKDFGGWLTQPGVVTARLAAQAMGLDTESADLPLRHSRKMGKAALGADTIAAPA